VVYVNTDGLWLHWTCESSTSFTAVAAYLHLSFYFYLQ
jgi:hypothetical protein